MKIKCLYNSGKDLPKDVYIANKYDEDIKFQVTINENYTVYGITTIKKYIWFLICDDTYDGIYIYYPLYLPSHLFTLIDGKISSHWICGEGLDEYDDNNKIIQFGFRELIEEEYFYGNLVEGLKRETEIFRNYKRLIDAE